MSEQARIKDLEVLGLLRAALLKFAQVAGESLSSADSQIASTHSWLENEQSAHWQSQLRKRTEAVNRARDAVRQKKMYVDSSGRRPGAVEEEKILDRCLAAVEQAEQKIVAIRKWIPRLEKEAELYHGGVVRLGRVVTDDVPNAVALLGRLSGLLEEYVQMEAPVTSEAGSVPVATEETMSRGSDVAAEPAAAAQNVAPVVEKKEGSAAQGAANSPANDSPSAPVLEDRDVGHGQ